LHAFDKKVAVGFIIAIAIEIAVIANVVAFLHQRLGQTHQGRFLELTKTVSRSQFGQQNQIGTRLHCVFNGLFGEKEMRRVTTTNRGHEQLKKMSAVIKM
jgi:hypothetical protein